MIHLVCGPIGAGKTTYARKIAQQHNAIYFSEDEWLSRLFVADAPADLLEQPMEQVAAWAQEKYQRCRSQIWLVSKRLLECGMSVVLDGAAANQIQREVIRQKAIDNNMGFQLHYISASQNIRHQRVLERNEQQGETYSLYVTPAMFDQMEVFFEAPKGEELAQAIVLETIA